MIFSPGSAFTLLEIMPRFRAAELDLGTIPAGVNAPLELLTGFTLMLRISISLPIDLLPSFWENPSYSSAKISLFFLRKGKIALITRRKVITRNVTDIGLLKKMA